MRMYGVRHGIICGTVTGDTFVALAHTISATGIHVKKTLPSNKVSGKKRIKTDLFHVYRPHGKYHKPGTMRGHRRT